MAQELDLIAEADGRARTYLETLAARPPFPDQAARDGLAIFAEPLTERGHSAVETLRLLDVHGSPATTASNGPRYFGFVIGAALPAAAAVERLMLAWDQCASSYDNSPVAATVEKIAGAWLLDILDLPRESGVGFGTSATACTLIAYRWRGDLCWAARAGISTGTGCTARRRSRSWSPKQSTSQ